MTTTSAIEAVLVLAEHLKTLQVSPDPATAATLSKWVADHFDTTKAVLLKELKTHAETKYNTVDVYGYCTSNLLIPQLRYREGDSFDQIRLSVAKTLGVPEAKVHLHHKEGDVMKSDRKVVTVSMTPYVVRPYCGCPVSVEVVRVGYGMIVKDIVAGLNKDFVGEPNGRRFKGVKVDFKVVDENTDLYKYMLSFKREPYVAFFEEGTAIP
ncbi:Hypothetical protein POVN_LOCUS639 [uncultured virus]|nr:Hypothetical protein POVN_LOCUS639 [uncultured virus]